MTTLATSPALVLPARPCRLTFGTTEPGANHLRIWVVDAPDGSSKKAELDKEGEKRVHLYSGPSGSIDFTPDVGGIYRLLCQEYVKGTAYGGGYEGDPNGAPSETQAGSEVTLDLVVGQRVTQQLGYGSDTATLVCWVFGTTFQPTTLVTHGEDTPAIVEPTSLRAAIAAKSPAVLATMANMSTSPVSTAVGDLGAMLSDLAAKYTAHRQVAGTVHQPSADSENTLPAGLASSAGPKNAADVVNRLISTFRNHVLNTDGPGGGDIGSAVHHTVGGNPKSDRTNLPIVESAGDLAQAYAAIGDMIRCYESHRLSTAVHGTADAANPLGSMPVLVTLHSHFFAALASTTPDVPPTLNSGVVTAVSIAGFTES